MAISNVTLLGQIQTALGLIENSPYNCQIARVFPFMGIDGYGITFPSIDQIVIEYGLADENPAELLADAATAITEHLDSPDTSGSPPMSPTFMIGELATRYGIPYSQQDRYQVPNDLVSTYKLMAERRLVYKYFSMIGEVGGTNESLGQFPGLSGICDGTRVTNLAGAALTVQDIDRMYYAVTEGPGRPNAIMSHSRVLRTVLSLMVAANQTWPMEYVDVEMPDPIRGKAMVKIPSWRGTPWYVNDLLRIEEVTEPPYTTGKIFFMLLGDSEMRGAGRGITGIVPRSRVGDMFVHRPTNHAGTKPLINMDCTWPVGLAMGSQGSLSILNGGSLIT